MLAIEPTGGTLGARVTGIDLARPLGPGAFVAILRALGQHGVLCFPGQSVTPATIMRLGAS